MGKRRRSASAPQRILRAVVLPTLGALSAAPFAAGCDRNPFTAGNAGTTPHTLENPVPPGMVAQPPPGPPSNAPLTMPYLAPPPGTAVAVGRVAAPGVVAEPPAPPPPGTVAPPPRPVDAGAATRPRPGSRPPGVIRAPGRHVPRPGPPARDDLVGLTLKLEPEPPSESSPEARRAVRRQGRTNGSGERDPGCAGAGALRRRGPT